MTGGTWLATTSQKRNDGGVGTNESMTVSKDIEISECKAFHAVGTGKDFCLELVLLYGDGLGFSGFPMTSSNLGSEAK